jgi:tetratricopeptide (TPR) repeat protein
MVALATACVSCSPVAGAAGQQSAQAAAHASPAPHRGCPSSQELDAALGNASTLMEQSQYQNAAVTLQSLSALSCDARVSLLLAAAFDGSGNVPKATETLQRAHTIWLSNNSISASLAREYLAARQVNKAVEALAHFHVTAATPLQEIDLAVVVYLDGQQLIPAQAAAAAAYKSYPSLHTLLMLANALQLEGRYPDVNRLLGDKRATYAASPEFLITLAESEFDAGIYASAREDLEHAISLNKNLYQAHYLLGNTLFRLNDVDKAIAEYHMAIDLAPDQPRTYFQLALVLRSKQDEAGEERVLEQALAADDHYAPAHCEMGRLLLEEHRPADAVSHLAVAIQYNPRSEEAYFLLARAYAGLGEKDKSNEMVKRLITVRKENRPGTESKNGSHPAAKQETGP